MAFIEYSPGALHFFDTLEEQQRFKEYTYGKKAPINIGLNRIPPFQVVIPLTSPDINEFVIVHPDGTEDDRFSVIQYHGFETRTFPNYKIAIWAGASSIPLLAAPPGDELLGIGTYYLKLSNGVNTIYSEQFCILDDLTDHVKVEYCHGEDFPLPGDRHIDYRFGYLNFFYFKTHVGKPEYVQEDKAEPRDGFDFYEQMIRYKLSRFEVIVPEEVIDALSLIPLHDTIRVIERGKTHDCDDLSLASIDWQEHGAVAAVEVEFKAETVVVVNAKGVANADSCGVADCACFAFSWNPTIHTAVASIIEGGDEWNGEYYLDQYDVQIPFVVGDLVVVLERPADTWNLYEFTAGGFVLLGTDPGEYVCETNTPRYYYDNNLAGLIYTHITNISGTHVDGEAVPVSMVELWALLADGQEVLLNVGPSDDFTTSGFDFTPPATPISALRIKASTALCEDFYVGAWQYLDPFGLLSCAANYVDDPDAIANGILPGEFYCLDIANPYGMIEALVKRLDPFTGYASDAAAVAALGRNVVYQLAAGNNVGAPSGICRIAVDGTIDVYDSDAAAATGGVAVGEFYAYNPAGVTTDNYCFVKKRQS